MIKEAGRVDTRDRASLKFKKKKKRRRDWGDSIEIKMTAKTCKAETEK